MVVVWTIIQQVRLTIRFWHVHLSCAALLCACLCILSLLSMNYLPLLIKLLSYRMHAGHLYAMMDMCCRLGYSHLPGSAWEMSNSQAFLVDDWRVMACLPSTNLSV